MARRLFGVTVVRNGRLLVPSFLAVVVGGPLYAYATEIVAWIDFIGRGLASIPAGIIGFATRWVETFFGAPEAGFTVAQFTFATSVREFGLLAYFVALIVASVVVAIILLGVTRVSQ